MRRTMKLGALLLAVGALAFVAVFAMSGFNFDDFARKASWKRVTYRPEGTFDRVELTDVEANIRILPAEDGACRVLCDETGGASYAVEIADGALAVRRERNWLDSLVNINFVAPELSVYLPDKDYERISVSSVSGDVRVKGLRTGAVKIKTTSGDVELSQLEPGDIEVGSVSGDVCIKELRTGAVKVKTTSGDVELSQLEPGDIEVSTVSGDVALWDCAASGKVNLRTTSGEILLEDADGAGFEIATVSGDVEGTLGSGKVFSVRSISGAISVPESAAGQGAFDVSTTSGDVEISIKS